MSLNRKCDCPLGDGNCTLGTHDSPTHASKHNEPEYEYALRPKESTTGYVYQSVRFLSAEDARAYIDRWLKGSDKYEIVRRPTGPWKPVEG